VLQDDELLPEIDNLGLTFRRRATQPSDQGRDKSQKMGHRTGSLPDSKRVARLDKIIGSDNRVDRVFGSDKQQPLGESDPGPTGPAPSFAQTCHKLG
jgi:hypothetical protein